VRDGTSSPDGLDVPRTGAERSQKKVQVVAPARLQPARSRIEVRVTVIVPSGRSAVGTKRARPLPAS
jgi:hypothetical protein